MVASLARRLRAKLAGARPKVIGAWRYILRLGPEPVALLPTAPDAAVEFAIAGPEHLAAYLELGEDTRARADRCLARGDRLVIGQCGGQLCYYGWIYYPPRRSQGPMRAHIYKCFTAPSWRGKGLYPAGLRFALSFLQQSGVQEVTVDVVRSNTASIRGIEKAGFELLGGFWRVTMFGGGLMVMPRRLRAYGASV